ncbi:hypothetical protein [Acetobacterium tundrae]|uniref:Pilus assembly protein PilM n=1 Tax=Acetobacterium tundrae TaxID=132932 RepID=A0ABR6WN55_9FIRM|nr:hypothetical protein [Acetobacterium tundrae]MBC3797842.1 hypothetical protein [Acetobacterium tundrae]
MKKKKRQWVVDLGEEVTKITKGFSSDAGIIQIENYWIEKTPNDVFNEGIPEKKIDLVVFLRTLLKEHHRSDDLLLIINHKNMVVSSFAFPMMQLEEVKEAINWKMQVMIPEKLDNWRIDFLAKERTEIFEYLGIDDKKLDVLGVAVHKEVLKAYCKVFNSTKHGLKRIEPQFSVLGKLFAENQKNADLIIDMGQTSARLLFYDHGFLQEERRIEMSGSSDFEIYLISVVKGIKESFQSPLGLARGYENSNIYLLGGKSLEYGVLNYIKEKINKEVKYFSIFLEDQSLFHFPKEMTEAELCLLLPCLSGMLK